MTADASSGSGEPFSFGAGPFTAGELRVTSFVIPRGGATVSSTARPISPSNVEPSPTSGLTPEEILGEHEMIACRLRYTPSRRDEKEEDSMVKVTWFRGTREEWERKSIKAGVLRSYRQELWETKKTAGYEPPAFGTLTTKDYDAEVVKRVGVETALGTPNAFSHFVPLGTNRKIATGFGDGECFVFFVDCVLISGIKEADIKKSLAIPDVKKELAKGAVPLFQGGHWEYLAYTGTKIVKPILIAKGKQLPADYENCTLAKLFPKAPKGMFDD